MRLIGRVWDAFLGYFNIYEGDNGEYTLTEADPGDAKTQDASHYDASTTLDFGLSDTDTGTVYIASSDREVFDTRHFSNFSIACSPDPVQPEELEYEYSPPGPNHKWDPVEKIRPSMKMGYKNHRRNCKRIHRRYHSE